MSARRRGASAMTNTVAAAESGSRMVHMPGDGAMWVMVIGDLIIFGAYFIIFMVHRAMKPGVFLASQQHLNITIGVVNTLVLLASSWFIARSVQCTRAGEGDRALRLTYLGGLCGVWFVGINADAGGAQIAEGYALSGNEFF